MTAFYEQIQEVEYLTDELNALLLNNHSILKQADVGWRVKQLTHWATSYRHGLHYGLLPGDQISENEQAWVIGVGDRLRLENTEPQRLENQDGRESRRNADTCVEISDFIKSAHQIRKLAIKS